MKVTISIRVIKGGRYYDPGCVEREISFESEDIEAVHTLAAKCGEAVETMAVAAVETRVEYLAEEEMEAGTNGD